MVNSVVVKENEISSEETGAQQASLTFAHLFMLMIAILAVVLRFSGLADAPLSPAEAGQALAVWQFWQPGAALEIGAASPAYFSLTSVLMSVLGSSDAIMRLVPASFGVALVLLPWLMRERLGTVGALTASLLMAVSPILTAISRTAGGDAIALFAGLLLLVSWLRYQDTGAANWLYTGAAALGLGLTGSALFLTVVAGLGLAWLVQATLGPRLFQEVRRPDKQERRIALATLVVVFLAVSTLFLWRLAGLGGAAANVAEWLSLLVPGGDLGSWISPLLTLLRYEPALFILGIPALAWATWRGFPLPGLLVYWFVMALLLALLQHQAPATIAPVLLAGYLLVGVWIEAIFNIPSDELTLQEFPISPFWLRWGLFAALITAAAVIYFNLGRYLRVAAFTPDQMGHLLLTIVALVLAVALVNLARALDRAIAYQSTVLALIVVFVLYGWGTAWWLAHEGANDPRERWVTDATDDEVRLMADILRETSLQSVNSAGGLALLSGVDSPVLRWYLRDIEGARFGNTVPAGATEQAIITPAAATTEGDGLNLESDYFGADFGYIRRPTEADETARTFYDDLRWWLFHQRADQIVDERIILWVRTDLALGDTQ